MALAGLPCHLPASHPSKALKQLVPHIPAPAPPGWQGSGRAGCQCCHCTLTAPSKGTRSCCPVRLWDTDSVLSHPLLSHTLLSPYLMLLPTHLDRGRTLAEGRMNLCKSSFLREGFTAKNRGLWSPLGKARPALDDIWHFAKLLGRRKENSHGK